MIVADEKPPVRVCGANLRNKPGCTCRKPPVTGRNRCELHGGLTPRGLASANTKTGRYSKDVPTQLSSRYEEARQDQELLNLRDDIAIAEARTGELLSKLGEGADLQKAIQHLQNQITKGGSTPSEITAEIQKLTNKLTAFEGATWAEVREQQEKKRKLIESERRRLRDMAMFISVEQVMLLMSRVQDIVMRNVTIANDRAVIGRELQTLAADSLFATDTDQDE